MLVDTNQFLAEQRAAIAQNQIDRVLRNVTELFFQFGNTVALQGRHISSPLFDYLCQEVGQRSASQLLGKKPVVTDELHHIIVFTEMVALGGHAELIRDIIRASEYPVVLLATNINSRTMPVLEQVAEEENVRDVIVTNETTLLGRLRTVQAFVSNPAAEKIFLVAHGYDAVAVAAISPELGHKTYYLHHCDHYPALGCYLKGVHHVDLHNIGFNRCRYEHNISNNRYLCLTSSGVHTISTHRKFATPCFKSATCGSEHKLVTLSYHTTYKEVILSVLKRHNGVHFHIGRLSNDFLSQIYGDIKEHGMNEDQFVYVGEAPNLSDLLTNLEIDLYVPTLPQAGGKALIDAMSVGIPVLIHQNARDRLWGGLDLAYPEAPSWGTITELNEALDRFDDEYWRAQSMASRSYFERFHALSLFASQLKKGGSTSVEDIPPPKSYLPDVGCYLQYSGL